MIRPAWHDAALAAELAAVPLTARQVGSGVTEGRHASRVPGPGLEFSQYRGYQSGDDLRRVDWKLLARSDRFFVREADAETALPIRIVLDASASMAHEEDGIRKFDAARRIAAALAENALRHGDLPSLAILTSPTQVVPPSRDRRQVERIFDALDRASPGGRLPPDIRREIAALGGGADGVLLVITDWHDPDNTLLPAIERTGLDVTLLVLRTARERTLQYGRPVTLEDLETGVQVVVDDDTRHSRAATDATRHAAARRAGIDVATIDPGAPLAPALRTWLAARAGRR